MKIVHGSQGFTLIELLVVFAAAGILAGLGFAAFFSYSKKQIVMQTREDMRIAIERIKFNTLSQVNPPSACSGKALSGYKIVITPPSTYTLAARCDGQDTILSDGARELPGGVSFTANTTCQDVLFQSVSNTVTGTTLPCVIEIQGYGLSQKLTIETSGLVH